MEPSGWQVLDWPDGEFAYCPALWSVPEADALLERLRGELVWQQHSVRLFGRDVPSPRLSAWHGDEGVSYRYSGHRYQALAWAPVLHEVKQRIEAALCARFNGVLANRYRDGRDGMGWHSDDEPELGPEPIIVSASFGAARTFWLRHRGSGRRETLTLAHGSVLCMAGASQRCWQHALAKTRRSCGERINLTFRQVLTR